MPGYTPYRWAETPEGCWGLTLAWLWCSARAELLGLDRVLLGDVAIEVTVDQRWHRESAWRVGQLVRGLGRTLMRDATLSGWVDLRDVVEGRRLLQPPSYWTHATILAVPERAANGTPAGWAVRVGWGSTTHEVCVTPSLAAAREVASALRPTVVTQEVG